MCTKKRGAALTLPTNAQSKDTVAEARFQEWITTHIASVFDSTEKLGLGLKVEEIIIVTGFHRTRSWSNVTFNEARSGVQFSIGFEVPSTVGFGVNWNISRQLNSRAVHNQGPSGEVCDAQITRADR